MGCLKLPETRSSNRLRVTTAAPSIRPRAAGQKARNQAAREASIRRGLDDLHVWISDQNERGFGSFAAQASDQHRLLAKRRRSKGGRYGGYGRKGVPAYRPFGGCNGRPNPEDQLAALSRVSQQGKRLVLAVSGRTGDKLLSDPC